MNASRRFSLLIVAAALLVPLYASAATSEVRVLFDVDSDLSTGCTVGGMAGVDQVLVTQITDSPTAASVTQTHRLVCSAGILSGPTDVNTTGWPAAWQSSSGMMLVETRIPFSAFGSSSMPTQMRVGFDGTRGAASFSVLAQGDGSSILIPIAAHRRRAVGFPDEPRMIVLDGLNLDWGMINSLAAGGGAGAIRLVNAFGFPNPLDSFLYFRFDLNLSGSGILAVDDLYTRLQGSNLTQAAPGVLANDQPNTLPLTAAAVTSPSHGSVTLNPDGSFTYTPTSTQSLTTDTFEYKAVSGAEESNVAKVTIKVASTNSAPKVVNATFSVNENSPNGTPVGIVQVTDTNAGDDHTWLIQSGNVGNAFAINPTTGAITVADSSALNFEVRQQYVLVVKATDDGHPPLSDTGNITINVNNVNDEPVAVNDSYNVAEEGTLTIGAPGVLGNDTDQDVPHTLTASIVTGPAHAASFGLNPNGSFNYTPVADYVGSDSFVYQANDGSLASNDATVTITVTAVNDPPSFAVGPNQTVNEDAGPQTVPGWATSISPGPANESDQSVSFVIDNNTNLALFSGQPAVAPDGTLTYTPAANANGVATITLHAVDNGPLPGTNASATQMFTITVNPVNDPPTFNLGGNQTVNEDSGVQTVGGFASSISVGPADESAQTITAFNVSNDNNSIFDVQPAIAPNGTLTYTPAADASGTATVSVTATDSGGATSSPAQTFTITITPVNDAPALTAGGVLNYTENDAPTAIDSTVTITDIDSTTMAGATVQITGNYVNGEDVLSFAGLGPITGSFNAGSGTLTLSGTSSLANYQTALRSVLYANTSDNPSTAARTVTWQVNDGGAVNNLSNTPTSTINVAAVNDAPVINSSNTVVYTEDGPPVVLNSGLTLTDADSTNIQSALVVISGNFSSGNDVLACPACGGTITAIYSPGGSLQLSGVDTVANYQTALRSVTFANTSNNPSTAQRGIDWFATDTSAAQSADNAQNDTLVNVVAVNDAPVVTAGGVLAYTENQAATAIDGTVTVSDADSVTLTGATVQITTNYQNGQDVLSFANTANITGVFTAATGTMTLTGVDTLANYQTALRNVQYANTSENPSTAARTVSWQVDDGAAVNNLSAVVTSTINVTAVNDAPVVNAATNMGYTEGTGAQVIDNTLTVTDVDSTQISGATIQVSTNYVNGEDILGFVNTVNITGNFVAASGTLTLAGTDTLAAYQAALRTVTYLNTSSNPSIAPRTITWTVTDTAAAPGSDTTTINITPVNSAPVLTAGGTLNYTENQAATAIDTTVTVVDADTPNLASATVTLTTNYQNGQDVLSFTTMFGITGNFVAGTGTLTLTGSTTPANWQTALRSVKYNNTSDNPSTLARTVQWQINDGEAISNLSNTPTSTINVAAVNDAPVLANGGTVSYTENAPPVTLAPSITVTDADNTTLTGATVGITGNWNGAQDVLACPACGGPITGSYNAGSGLLTLSGVATVAQYQTALASVTYQNTSENPTAGPRGIDINATDGSATSNNLFVQVNIVVVNDAPAVTAGGTLSYTENQAATAIDSTVTVSDLDNANLASATIQITGNYVNGQDVLSFADTANITGNFVAATGTMTLTGSDTVANYQTALRNVKYANTSEAPSTLARTVSWTVNDGSANSNTATSTINVTATNDAPVNALPAAQGTNEDTPLILTGATKISISDVDANPDNVQVTLNVTLGTVTLNAGAIGALASLTGNGTATVVATGTVANVNAALDGLTFNPTPNASGAGSIQVVTSDLGHNPSGALTDTDTLSITVNPINDAPALSVTGTLNYTENQAAASLITSAIITDADNTTMASATVQITGNYQNGQDVLSYVTALGITGNFVAGTGTLTLTGTATLADYQTALQNVKYVNTSENPSALQRTVTWTVNDGAANSNSPTSTVNVTAVNDVPTINAGDLAYTEDAGPVVIDATLTANDIDDPLLPSATVQITTNYVNGEDILAFTNAFGITGNFVAATGTLTLTGPASPANFQSALRTVTYQNTSNTPSAAPRTVVWTLNDDEPSSGTDTSTITVTPTNDAPVLTLSGTLNYTENDPATNAISAAPTIVDVDDTNIESATIQITGNYSNGQDVLSYVTALGISGNFVAGTGTLTLTGSATLANYQTALQNVKYVNTSEAPSTLARTLTWRVNDGDVNSNSQTSTINITAVNDPPVNTPPTNAQSVNEDTALNFTGAGNVISISDPDVGAGTLTVQIVTTNGTTTIVTPGAVVFGGGGNGTANYTMTGTLAQVNSAIGTLRFDPTLNFPGAAASGVASIQLITSDNGNSPTPAQTDTDSFNITVNQVNDPPVATNETFDTIGNTELRVDIAAGTDPMVATTTAGNIGVRSNDSDPVEGNAFTVTSIVGCADVATPYVCTLASGSVVSMNANGTFTFIPSLTLANGAPTNDTFSYVITDQPAAGTPLTATGTVTIRVYDKVWYVKQGASGDGHSNTPLGSFTGINGAGGAGDGDGVGDYIFVHNTGTALTSSIELEASQHLLGEGVALTLNRTLNGGPSSITLVPAGTRPVVTSATDTIKVTQAMPVEISGLSLASTAGNAIDITASGAYSGSGTLTIGTITYGSTTAEGLDANLGATGTLNLNLIVSNFGATPPAGNAIDVRTTAGTVNLGLNTLVGVNSGANGIFVDGSGGGTLNIPVFSQISVDGNVVGTGISVNTAKFDQNPGGAFDTVNAGALSIGSSGNPAGASALVLTSVSGDLSFTDLDLFSSAGAALRASGTAAYTGSAGFQIAVPGSVASAVAIGGPAVDLNTVKMNNLPFVLASSTNSATTGIALNAVLGTFSAGSGSSISGISSAAGTSFQVGSSNASITYDGTITSTTGKGVDLTTNTGSTITFTNTLSLSSLTNTAFNATGGGTVSTNNTSSTITSTTGVGLNVVNTTIGAAGLVFRSINVNGAANGIILNNTGATAGLTVSGTGSAGTGGTIQNITNRGASFISARGISLSWMNFTNANTSDGATSDGTVGGNENTDENGAIHLATATNVALSNININGTTSQHGINGNNVTNLDLTNVSIDNTGDEVWESGIYLFHLKGLASTSQDSVWNNVDISNTGQFNVSIINASGTNGAPGEKDKLTITNGCNFSNSGKSVIGDHVSIFNSGTANFQVVVSGATFNSKIGGEYAGVHTSDGIQVDASGSSARFDATIGTSTFSDAGQAAINLSSAIGGIGTFSVVNNSNITVRASAGINVSVVGSGSLTGEIKNNVISTNVTNNAGFAMNLITNDNGAIVANIEGNNVQASGSNMFDYGIRGGARGGNGSAHFTLKSNTVGNSKSAGLWLFAGNGTVGESNRTCVNFSTGNTIDAEPATQIADYFLEQYTGTTFNIQGLTGSGTNATNVQNYVASTDLDPAVGDPTVTAGLGTVVNYTNATCTPFP